MSLGKSSVQRKLEAGEQVTGVFAPAGADFETPGVLSWSIGEGALLELAGREDPWPTEFGEPIAIHGYAHGGQSMTLLGAGLQTLSSFDVATRFRSSTLALGACITDRTRWPRASYRPAKLHEWLPETGLDLSSSDPDSLRLEWRRPPRREMTVRNGRVGFDAGAARGWGYSPEWTISTSMTFGVRPDEPMTIDELMTEFGAPLLAFVEFVADVPDAVVHESYFDPETDQAVVVLRRGRSASVREWNPLPGHLLFRAEDVEDERTSVQRWIDLWHRVDPALALFEQHIEQGRWYSAPRFLTLYSAAEGYWKATRTEREAWSPRSLARRAAVSPDLTGATDEAIALIGASRDYHAHLKVGDAFPPETIVDQTYESTRRLHALVQACLLREIGMTTAVIEERLRSHYENWPLP